MWQIVCLDTRLRPRRVLINQGQRQIKGGSLPNLHWYAIRVKPNRERITADSLRSRDYGVCLPTYYETNRRPARKRVSEWPLFPGYLFCRLDIENRLPILTIPGILYIVSVGRIPQRVDEREMAALLSVVKAGVPASPHPYFAIGDRVRLEHGPLTGLEGIVLAHKGEQKLIISISLLQRSIAVAVERAWIS